MEDSDIPSLPYLQAVVKEVLRLHPPGPIIIRECRQDCKIWNCPNDFCQERFLVSFEKEDVMKYIPFGAEGEYAQAQS